MMEHLLLSVFLKSVDCSLLITKPSQKSEGFVKDLVVNFLVNVLFAKINF